MNWNNFSVEEYMNDNELKWVIIVVGIFLLLILYPTFTLALLFLAGLVYLLTYNSNKKTTSDTKPATIIKPTSIEQKADDAPSFEKGYQFEVFVDAHFNKQYFTRVEWHAAEKQLDGYTESTKNPDFTFRYDKKKRRICS